MYTYICVCTVYIYNIHYMNCEYVCVCVYFNTITHLSVTVISALSVENFIGFEVYCIPKNSEI